MSSILRSLGLIRKAGIASPAFYSASGPTKAAPKFDLVTLYEIASRSWVLQEIFRAIIQEVKRPRWRIEPKFIVKCQDCGAEYQETVSECQICSSRRLLPPNPRQAKKLEMLIQRPNSNGESFSDILKSIIYHDLLADNWYLSIEYSILNDIMVPTEIMVRDPKFIRPIYNEYGQLKSGEFFCPIHFDYKNNPKIFSKPGNCPECGFELQETAYIQEISGEVTGRWGRKQMIHGSTHRVLPEPFGEPRAKALWNIINVIDAMDKWFMDTFSESRTAKIINFPRWDQRKLEELKTMIESERKRLEIYEEGTGTYRPKYSLRNLFIASADPISVHDISINPSELQLLDYYRIAIQAVCGVYGVQSLFIGYIERGRTGTSPALQIEVFSRTVEDIQHDKEEAFNNKLLPIFGITDWAFKFNPLEKRDRAREAEIEQRTANTVMTYLNAGFDVWFDEAGRLHKSSRPTRQQTAARPTGKTKPKKKESQATFQEINQTTVEREPFGSRPPTEEDEAYERED